VKVVLVRHGDTEWSRDGRHTSRTDLELTEAGRRQAEAAGMRLAGTAWSLVLCSPMRRAAETCLLAGVADRAVVDDDLREWDYGEYEGLTTDQILERDPSWSLWRHGCPGGELPDEVAARADRVIGRMRAAGGAVAAFSHGHVLRVVGARWVAEPPAFGAHLMLATGSVSTLGWEHGVPALTVWNDTSHHAGVSADATSEGCDWR
jgi:probable phosphoglycerate mutase